MTDNLLDTRDDLPQIDHNKEYLSELVGEGKKFKTVEDLAKGKFEADQYVEILKKRQDEIRADYLKMREENTTRARLEDLVDQLSKSRLASNDYTPPVNEDKNQPQYDPREVESLFENKLKQYELGKRQTENFNMVKDKLQQRYGRNYGEAIKLQIEDLGITETDLTEMAKKSPKVLLRTLGLDKEPDQNSFQSPPRSNQRNDNFAPKGAEKRTWSYYQNLRKINPAAYLDRKTAIQMQQDAIDLGEAFRDGDYFVKGLHENQ